MNKISKIAMAGRLLLVDYIEYSFLYLNPHDREAELILTQIVLFKSTSDVNTVSAFGKQLSFVETFD